MLLTTHYMDEAQYLADRVAVISAGRIVAEGHPATLADRNRALARIRYRLPAAAAPPASLEACPTAPTGSPCSTSADLVRDAAPAHGLGARQRDGPGRA